MSEAGQAQGGRFAGSQHRGTRRSKGLVRQDEHGPYPIAIRPRCHVPSRMEGERGEKLLPIADRMKVLCGRSRPHD